MWPCWLIGRVFRSWRGIRNILLCHSWRWSINFFWYPHSIRHHIVRDVGHVGHIPSSRSLFPKRLHPFLVGAEAARHNFMLAPKAVTSVQFTLYFEIIVQFVKENTTRGGSAAASCSPWLTDSTCSMCLNVCVCVHRTLKYEVPSGRESKRTDSQKENLIYVYYV